MRTLALLLAAVMLTSPPAFAQAKAAPKKPAATKAVPKPKEAPPVPSAPHVVPETGTLDEADLIAISLMSRKASADQFSDDPTSKYEGRDFAIRLPSSMVSVSYDRDAHAISVSPPSDVTFVDNTTSEEVPGVNGFGAHFMFKKIRGEEYGIASTDEGLKLQSYSWPLDGESARAISKSLSYRIQGKVTSKISGYTSKKPSVVKVDSVLADATASDPYDIFIQHYSVNVAISHVDLVDGRTGAILKSWDQTVVVAPRTPETERRVAAKLRGAVPTSIRFVSQPSAHDLSVYAPIEAMLQHRAVTERFKCKVSSSYGLTDCEVQGPNDYNIYKGVLYEYRVAPRDADGDDTVGMPIVVQLDFPAR